MRLKTAQLGWQGCVALVTASWLVGGSQPGLELAGEPMTGDSSEIDRADGIGAATGGGRPARTFEPDAAELTAHEALVDQLNDPIWRR